MKTLLNARRDRVVAALLGASLIAGCGGSSPGVDEARPTVLTGVVVSSYGEAPATGAAASPTVAGARVFLDLNRNLTQESDEPESEPTDSAGRFSLPIDRSRFTDAQIDQALVVARAVTDDARAQLPVPMAAPAAVLRGSEQAREINMITHLVAAEMAVSDGTQVGEERREISVADAVARIRGSVRELESMDLFGGIASAPSTDALRSTARVVAAKVLSERDAALRRVAEARARDEAVQQVGSVQADASVALLATGDAASADSDAVRQKRDELFDQKRAEVENEPAAIDLADLMRQVRETLPAMAPIAGGANSPTATIEQIQARIEQARAVAEEELKQRLAQEREARRLELEARLEEARQAALKAKLEDDPPSVPEQGVITPPPAPPEELAPLPDPARIARELAEEREALRNLNRVTLIVVFKPRDSLPVAERRDAASRRGEILALPELANDLRGAEGRVFERAIEGFTVTLPQQAADRFIERMQSHPRVDRVEIDEPVRVRAITGTQAPTLSWGVDRSDASQGLSNSFSWSASGEGVTAYIVDTGITPGSLFGTNQILSGYNSLSNDANTLDCNGHGTHVAGTVASPGYGIAKGAALVPVRVLDCNGAGSLSTVIAGLDWILGEVSSGRSTPSRAVVNLSLGGGASSTLDQAVAKLVQAGVTTVVAAGNNADDACNYSPARVRDALTVAASDWNDARASFSNYGACVDLFAPGQSITSVATDGNTARTLSGTSMAAPHVTGAVAQWLQAIPDQTPAQVSARVLAAATQNRVTGTLGSPNLLLFAEAEASTDAGGGVPPEPTLAAVSIGGLTASAARVSRNGNWRASVSVLVRNASGAAVAGATVGGDFSTGGTGLTCTTGSTGRCTITSGTLSKNLASTTWTVKTIAGTGLQYQASGNTVSSITVSRPK